MRELDNVVRPMDTAVIVIFILGVSHVVRHSFGRKLSAKILHKVTDSKELKEPLVAVWTNLSMVSALMFPLTCGMLTVELPAMKADYEEVFYESGTIYSMIEKCGKSIDEIGVYVYLLMTFLATLSYMQAIIKAVMHIIAVAPLNDLDFVKFTLANLHGVGAPMVDMLVGLVGTFVAMGIWISMIYGETGGVLAILGVLWVLKMIKALVWTDVLAIDYTDQTAGKKDQWVWAKEDAWRTNAKVKNDDQLQQLVEVLRKKLPDVKESAENSRAERDPLIG